MQFYHWLSRIYFLIKIGSKQARLTCNFDKSHLIELNNYSCSKTKNFRMYFIFTLLEIIHIFCSLAFKVALDGKSWAKVLREIDYQCQLIITTWLSASRNSAGKWPLTIWKEEIIELYLRCRISSVDNVKYQSQLSCSKTSLNIFKIIHIVQIFSKSFRKLGWRIYYGVQKEQGEYRCLFSLLYHWAPWWMGSITNHPWWVS